MKVRYCQSNADSMQTACFVIRLTSKLFIERGDVQICQILERFIHRQFARVFDDTFLLWWSAIEAFNFPHNLHAFENSAKHDMLPIQMRSLDSSNEKLTSISVLASICHRQLSRTCVLEHEVFVCKFLTINGLPTCAITLCKVSTLNHEVLDDTVEFASFVTKTFLSSGKSAKVFCGFGHSFAIQAHHDAASIFTINCHVEVHFVSDDRLLCRNARA
mmetsp:Transcript_25912/g.41618  ORF Transcript_25912/g.41618 Transcript_25912/m.41618 type:complete len:217 (-) Transcript_25912:70-720(-)